MRMTDKSNIEKKAADAGSAGCGQGILFLCATPIGNLEDITLRVLRTLKEADLIAAEDTRHTRKLLTHFDIHQQLTSYHEHNKKSKAGELIGLLQQGKNIALVTDAGLPGISDPGSDLVAEAINCGLQIVVLPGATAGVSALTVSGLPTERFVFEAFLPAKSSEYRQKLTQLSQEQRTIIFYEAPHRLVKTLQDVLDAWGDRPAAVIRELTKKFEEIRRDSLSGLLAYYQANSPRGEITVVVGGRPEEAEAGAEQLLLSPAEEVDLLMQSGMDKKQAIKQVAQNRRLAKREVYSQVLQQEKDSFSS